MTVLVANPQPGVLTNGHSNPLSTSIAQPEKNSANGHSNSSIPANAQPEKDLADGHSNSSIPAHGHSNSSISAAAQPEALTNGHSTHKNYQRVIPTAIDEIAHRSPNAVFASISKTSNPANGYRDVTYRVYADTIDRAALLLEESIKGKDHGEAIGYIGPSDLRYVILAIAAVKINMKV